MDESPECFQPGQEESMMPQQLPRSPPGYDWSQLPADLLIRIFIALDVLDLCSVRAVCQSWRLSYLTARRLGSCCTNQSPCLLYSDDGSDPNMVTLLRLSTNQLYRVPLPDPPFRGNFLVGSSHGWLAIADELSRLLLVNPLTRAQLALPSPLTIKNVRGWYNTKGVLDRYYLLELDLATKDCDVQDEPVDLTLEEGRFYFYLRLAMSADPSSRNCVVMILHMPQNHLSFARVGNAHWTWVDVDQRCCRYHHIIYNDHDGLFYAIRGNGELHTIDPNGPSPQVNFILKPMTSLVNNNKYIVRAPWGDFLQVWRYDRPIKKGEYRTIKLEVLMVDLVEQKLVEMKNLKDHVLFIGFNAPIFLPAKHYPFLTPNCIYLTDDNMDYIYNYKFGPRQVVVFNMRDGSFTDMFPDSNSCLNWPIPSWITPSDSHQDSKRQFICINY